MGRLIERQTLQYRLIQFITWEMVFFAVVLVYMNWMLHFYVLVYELIAGTLSILANLIILKRTQNTMLCGHIICVASIVTMVYGNYFIGGLTTSYIAWFLVMPILAAATLGLSGLMIYTPLSMLAIFGFYAMDVTPHYVLPEHIFLIMSVVNIIFPLLIISTTTYIILSGYLTYENLLRKNNLLLREEKQKFRYLARYDALTNLPNRSYFQIQLESFLTDMDPKKSSLSVLFMDLDGMKETNDTLGHDAGDMLLSLAGKRLKSCLRGNDFLARIGGDEFVAIVHHSKSSKLAEKLAQRILREFQKPFNINGATVNSTISMGLAVFPQDGQTAETLLNAADQLLYTVKAKGGNNYTTAAQLESV